MRHFVTVVSLLLISAAAPAAPLPVDDTNARCPKAITAPGLATFKRLGELPPAIAFNAVLRSSDCPAQTIQARDRLGAFPRPRR